MASFKKRGKTWYYSMYVGFDANGKHKKVMKGGFRTKKDAENAVAAIQTELANGTYIQEKDITFSVFAKSWLKMYANGSKDSSIRIRSHEVDKLNKYFKNIKLKDITKKQYQGTLLELQKEGFAENTISGVHGAARMLFKKAVEFDIIKSDPTQYARPPRKRQTLADIESENEVPKYLEKDELKEFLRFAHDGGIKDDYTIFLTLAYTGMRAGELCALKWTDVDFESHEIKITKTYYNPTNNIRKYDLQPPKTKTSKRTIRVSNLVINELKLRQARQEFYKSKIIAEKKEWYNEGFIFCSNKYPGYPLYIKVIESRMSRLLRISELNEDLTPHSLRHTHTSLLAEAGVSLEEIMERLGHTDDDTTRRVYLHVTKDMKKEAVHKFDSLMNDL